MLSPTVPQSGSRNQSQLWFNISTTSHASLPDVQFSLTSPLPQEQQARDQRRFKLLDSHLEERFCSTDIQGEAGSDLHYCLSKLHGRVQMLSPDTWLLLLFSCRLPLHNTRDPQCLSHFSSAVFSKGAKLVQIAQRGIHIPICRLGSKGAENLGSPRSHLSETQVPSVICTCENLS